MRMGWTVLVLAAVLVLWVGRGEAQRGSPMDQLATGGGLLMGPRHAKTARTTRGFKNLALSTARGFGKRGASSDPQEWQVIEQDQSSTQPRGLPVAWMAEQMQSNPGLARLILRRFVDADHDDLLSPEELLRSE